MLFVLPSAFAAEPAVVTVDGEAIGALGAPVTLALDPGPHALTFEQYRRRTVELEIAPRSGEALVIAAPDLERVRDPRAAIAVTGALVVGGVVVAGAAALAVAGLGSFANSF